MRYRAVILAAVGLTFMAGEALAGMDVFVYPSKGQSKDQQEQDEFACYKWAKEQTGFDPTVGVQQAAAPPVQGGAVSGAAKGAAVGAIGGGSAAMQGRELRSALESARLEALTDDDRPNGSSRQLNSKPNNSMTQTPTGTSGLSGPV